MVERIDPAVETARYSAEVLAGATGLDDRGPLAAGGGSAVAVHRGDRGVPRVRADDRRRPRSVVVLDTAPTGHTLLLLDAAQSYQREVQRTNAQVPDEVSGLLDRLRDPSSRGCSIVTLAESTPVHEADRLQADLRRAGIEPFGWLINASLTTQSDHPPRAASARCR